MDALLWILLPVLVAAGSAILSFYIMQARMEVAVSKERETLAAARAQLQAHEQGLQDKIRAAEETAHRKAFDQFLTDFRVEERHYMRESKSHFLTRKSMIMQERLYFRNIPLSNWVEHEMALEEGTDAAMLKQDSSVFSARSLSDQGRHAPKFLPQ
jgi:outer membrane murein-binding lipoprotein Lpp